MRCIDHITKRGESSKHKLIQSVIINIAIQTPLKTLFFASSSRFKCLYYNLLPFYARSCMAFPEKLLKTIARCAIFSLKFTENRLAAGLCPDPLGSLSAPADPLAAICGPTSKGRRGKGKEGK